MPAGRRGTGEAQRGGLEGRGLCSGPEVGPTQARGGGRGCGERGALGPCAFGPASARCGCVWPGGPAQVSASRRGAPREQLLASPAQGAWPAKGRAGRDLRDGAATAVCGRDQDARAAGAGPPAPTRAALRSQPHPPAASRGGGDKGGSPRLTGSPGPDRSPAGPAQGWPQARCHTTGSCPTAMGPRGPHGLVGLGLQPPVCRPHPTGPC